ncbi:conjugal transfer protein TrbL family protein [Tissierella carlieri]|uniref:conjugal transfer protein TrbL family protein n=1 Tax=Tissierella TaxID=41273 RepID=UPI003026ADDA
MGKIIMLLIQEFLEGLFDNISNTLLTNLAEISFYPENTLSSVGFSGFNSLFDVFFSAGISLIIIKFLKKGFEIYVLWTDGDADADPLLLLTNFARAIVVALTFPIMYGWLVEVITDLMNKAIGALGLDANPNVSSILTNLASGGIFIGIALLVFFIIYLLLLIQFYKRGFEILILRIGMPMACVGLMDADKGVFKSYIQKFFQSSITVLVQVVLAKLGLVLMIGGHYIWGFAASYFAIKTPKFLQEFLIMSSSGGSMMNTVYSGARLVEMGRRFAK